MHTNILTQGLKCITLSTAEVLMAWSLLSIYRVTGGHETTIGSCTVLKVFIAVWRKEILLLPTSWTTYPSRSNSQLTVTHVKINYYKVIVYSFCILNISRGNFKKCLKEGPPTWKVWGNTEIIQCHRTTAKIIFKQDITYIIYRVGP